MAAVGIAAFRDVCMDATEALTLGRFWSAALGGEFVDLGDKSSRVDHVMPGDQSIWIDPVPEPRSGKNRVHLDLRLPTADPAPLVAAGAVVLREPDDEISWWVLTDPDGNEFCAFAPRPGHTPEATEVYELVVDSANPAGQAAWWAAVTGGWVETSGADSSVAGAAGFPWAHWVFGTVPEPKTAKNRVHWDVNLTGADPGDLVASGARILREPDGTISWWIMADPEGNEFCAFKPA
jgi:hypothetical protein